MIATAPCPQCGAELPADAPRGHCACCLLALALSTGGEPDDFLADTGAPAAEVPVPEIANFRVLRLLGEGGFGIVYLAEQLRPVRRLVALKIIKPGMDTRAVVTRFAAERQALAVLDHPHIARVLDAGTTESGHPYFVMDYVAGVSITTFCAERKLTIPARLALLLKVCDAILHAHQKGVVHRDLKPGNILVAERDGRPVPVVIDFGIAKAVGEQRLVDATLYTAFERCLGTPAYMSPEQASLDGLDVDTRTDIYSLGVLLYELLTGQLPFASTGQTVSAEELRRRVREDEPPRPSARFAALPEESARTLAAERQSDPRRLRATLHGDLDWIAMRALEKDRARRYPSAAALAADLQHYLASEPIAARPPSRLYLFQRFARRHRVALLIAAAFAAILVTATALSVWQAVRATRAEKRALIEAAHSAQTAQFLQDMLASVDPAVAKGQDTTLLRTILDQAAVRLDRDLRDEPEIAAQLHQTIGWSYHKIAYEKPAEEHLRAAVQLYRSLPGRELNLSAALGWLAYAIRKGGGPEAEQFAAAREAFDIQVKLLATLPAGSDAAKSLADRSSALGLILFQKGRLAEAEEVFQRWLAVQRATLGDEAAGVASTIGYLGQIEEKKGNLADAGDYYRRELEIERKVRGADDMTVANSLRHFGQFQMVTGDFAGADTSLRQSLSLHRKYLDPTHPDLVFDLNALAVLEMWRGRLAEARALLIEAMPVCAKATHGTTEGLFLQVADLALIFRKQDRFPEAESLLLEAEKVQRTFPKPEAKSRRLILQNLADFYRASNRPDEAATWQQKLDALVKK
jgi:serine/threonine protein kinase